LRGGPFFFHLPHRADCERGVDNFSDILSTRGRVIHIFMWITANFGNTFDFFVETRDPTKIGPPRNRKNVLVTPLIFFGNTFDSFFYSSNNLN